MNLPLALISTVIISALVIGGCTHSRKNPEKHAEHIMQKITKKLDLNKEQKANLETLKDEILAVRLKSQSKRADTHKNVRDLLNAPQLDQDKALSLVNNHVKGIEDLAPRVLAAAGGFWDSLNPEQQAKVREKMEKHLKHHGSWNNGPRHSM